MDEELLEAWIRVSTAIRNDKIVSELTYNESIVCNFILSSLRMNGCGLTATQLCQETQIQKSQMNRILNALEKKDLIRRERSAADKRKVMVTINESKMDSFNAQHEKVLNLINSLIDDVGEQRAQELIEALNDLATSARKVLG